LAQTCEALGRWSSVFVFALLHGPGATGSPMTPVAFF
jgi:hypothetical protein